VSRAWGQRSCQMIFAFRCDRCGHTLFRFVLPSPTGCDISLRRVMPSPFVPDLESRAQVKGSVDPLGTTLLYVMAVTNEPGRLELILAGKGLQ
jgi:hypothetical protein